MNLITIILTNFWNDRFSMLMTTNWFGIQQTMIWEWQSVFTTRFQMLNTLKKVPFKVYYTVWGTVKTRRKFDKILRIYCCQNRCQTKVKCHWYNYINQMILFMISTTSLQYTTDINYNKIWSYQWAINQYILVKQL